MSAKALTKVVFPEPFGPRIKTPPILGLMAFISRASLSLSRETTPEKGKTTPRFNKETPSTFVVIDDKISFVLKCSF
jgi:hypothetical protein